jgi:hypothetical protein
MALSVPERIAQVAEHFAAHDAHGYSQPNRGTGATERVTLSDGSTVTVTGSDVDCSEMVRQCVDCAISGSHEGPIGYMWTGDEDTKLRAIGFIRLPFSASSVRRGDVLWVSGHTGVALGGGRQADAHGDEQGGITGPSRGDQTGCEVEVRALRPWTCIYRWAGDDSGSIRPTVAAFGVTAAGETNVRSAPSMSASVTGTLGPGERVECDGFLEADGRIWATYVANSGRRRYVSLGTAHNWVVVS